MAFSLIASTSDSLGATGGDSTAINTTGADLLVVVASWYAGVGDPTLTDSKSNTWTALTRREGAAPGYATTRMYWCVPSSVGSGHTFTLSGADTYCTISVNAFSGAHASPYEAENGSITGGINQAAGSVTPTEDNCLVVTGMCAPETLGAVPSVSGYTSDATNYVGATSMAGGIAHLIQTTAGATNPLWEWSGSPDTGSSAAVAVFKSAEGGGEPPPESGIKTLASMGVG
jgi:hypothetical protein